MCSREAAVTSAVGQIRRQVTGLTLFSMGEIRRAVEAIIDDILQYLSSVADHPDGKVQQLHTTVTATRPPSPT
jgi:hypothetical protein